MAKVATICDDYKVQLFKQEFIAANIPFTMGVFNVKGVAMFEHFSENETTNELQARVKPIVDKVTQYYIDHPPKRK